MSAPPFTAYVVVKNYAGHHISKATRNVLGEFTAPGRGLGDYRKWAGVLFLCTVVLWLAFR